MVTCLRFFTRFDQPKSLKRLFSRKFPKVTIRATAPAVALLGLNSLTPSAAYAAALSPDSFAPMRFTLVEGGERNCAPRCGRWVSAQGKIERGTAKQFAAIVAMAEGAPIFIHSPGGSMDEAMAMGRLIRAKKLTVVVAHTDFYASKNEQREGERTAWMSGKLSDQSLCASACTFVLASGAQRIVTPHSLIGVHRAQKVRVQNHAERDENEGFLLSPGEDQSPARSGPKNKSETKTRFETNSKPETYAKTETKSQPQLGARSQSKIAPAKVAPAKVAPAKVTPAKIAPTKIPPDEQAKQAQFKNYLTLMGMGSELWSYIQSADHSSMRWLAPTELKETNLVTHWSEHPDNEDFAKNFALTNAHPTKTAVREQPKASDQMVSSAQ